MYKIHAKAHCTKSSEHRTTLLNVLEGNDLDGKKIVKHTATRLPLTKDDYYDSTSSEPLISFDD